MLTRAVFVLLPVVPVIRLFQTNGLKQYVLERFPLFASFVCFRKTGLSNEYSNGFWSYFPLFACLRQMDWSNDYSGGF